VYELDQSEVGAMSEDIVRIGHPGPLRDRNGEFSAFMTAVAPQLGRVAYLLCGNPHRAEELAQAALVRTYEAWPRARTNDPYAYARRVLINVSIDRWRRTRREVLRSPFALPEHPAAGTPDIVENRDLLLRALFTLKARQRHIVVLRYLLDLTEREVAEELGIPVGTVKSGTSRGLENLRRAIGIAAEPPSTPTTSGGHSERR